MSLVEDEMRRDATGSPQDSVSDRAELMDRLRAMSREQLLEALHDGLCVHCVSVLRSRVQNPLNKNGKEPSLSTANMQAFHSPDTFSLSSLERSVESMSFDDSSTVVLPPRIHRDDHTHRDEGGDHSGRSENELTRMSKVVRKKDFVYMERINGKLTNILQGLELHTGMFNVEEQKKIVNCVYDLQSKGRKGELKERTYTEPRKWMRGKGRVTIQFGCCYNYAVDRDGNPPGIIRDEEVDPIPPLFKKMVKKLVSWHVLPSSCIPNSCIVNIYDSGDCIPPHIDHHDFVRPFCTISFLSEANILFGLNLKIVRPGEFSGPISIPLPVGSVLVLNGNGADVAKHCVPGVPAKRISITFRKMEDSKLPYKFMLDPELMEMTRLSSSSHSSTKLLPGQGISDSSILERPSGHQDNLLPRRSERLQNGSLFAKDDFPPLSSPSPVTQPISRRNSRQH